MRTILTIETSTPPIKKEVKRSSNTYYIITPAHTRNKTATIVFCFDDLQELQYDNKLLYQTGDFEIIQHKTIRDSAGVGYIHVPRKYAGLIAHVFINE